MTFSRPEHIKKSLAIAHIRRSSSGLPKVKIHELSLGVKDETGVSLDIEVRFAETDLMGVVHHSAYVVWLEAGRIAWMAAVGMPYTEVAAGGHHFAVTEVAIEYRTPAYFGDTVRLDTRLVELRSRQVEFEYQIHCAARDALLATGRSRHICVDLEGKMARIPEVVANRLSVGMAQLASDKDRQTNP